MNIQYSTSNEGKQFPPEVKTNLDCDYLQVVEFSRFESIPPWAFCSNIPITYHDSKYSKQKLFCDDNLVPKKVFQFFKEHPDEKHFIYDGKPYDFLNSLLTYINGKHENDVHRIWEIMKLDDGRNLYECFIVNTRVRDTLLNFIEPELKRLESMAGQEMAAQNLFSEPFKEYWKNNIAHLSHGYNYDIDFYPVMREDFLENLWGGMEEDELIIPKDCRAKMLVVSTYVSYNVHLGVLVYRPLQKIALAGNSAIALTATNISALK